jgi:ATP-dependent Clp protease ATP-binding subunit ClpA
LFKDVNAEDQRSIFRELLKNVNPDDVDQDSVGDWLADCGFDDQFGGRQVRNILSSAMDLARAENRQLRKAHIDTVIGCTKKFQRYLSTQMAAARDRAQPSSSDS